MSYATLTSALEGYLAAAAATMSAPPCNNVVAGEPTTVDRALIAYWFTGITLWDANSLDVTQEQWNFHIRIYYPLGGPKTPPRAQDEQWIAACASAIRAQLWGHVTAGGAATGLGVDVGDTTTAYATVRNVDCRIAEMDWGAQMANVAAIAAG